MKRVCILILLVLFAGFTFAESLKFFSIGNSLAKVGNSALPNSKLFTPTDIANCTLWLDASDLSTISTTSAGWVTTWYDKSGRDLHYTQTYNSSRPKYLSENGGCIKTQRDSGYNSKLKNTTGMIVGNAPRTIFIVASCTNAGYQCSFVVGNGGSGLGYLWTIHAGITSSYGGTIFAKYENNPMTLSNRFHIICIQTYSTAASTVLYTNGVSCAQSSVGDQNLYTGLAADVESNIAWHYWDASLDDRYAIRTKEIILYQRFLSKTELNKVFTYLGAKWNLQVNTIL